MGVEVRHLILLLAVSEEGSLTAASRRLHLTQSALSHQLRDAERILGRSLFERTGRRLLLTKAGDRLLRSARLVMNELELAEREIRGGPPGPEGLIRLATECYTCYHWLPAALEPFAEKFPGVEVRIVVEATREAVPALLEGALDLAVVSDPVRNPRIRVDPLFEDELVALLPSGHPLRKASHLEAADFASENLITYAISQEDLDIFQRVLVPAGVRPRKWTRVPLTEAIVELVRAGQGVSVMARWAAEPYARNKEVVIKTLTRGGFPRQWSAATLRRRNPPRYLSEFIRILTSSASPAARFRRRTGTAG